jgi:DNA repair photolyase
MEPLKKRRQFASFGGSCVLNCNHCYTFSQGYDTDKPSSVKELVMSLKGKEFDILYISGHRENFIDPNEGLLLCESVFDEFEVDLLITTRNVFSSEQIQRLQSLNKRMKKRRRDLFVCVSIPAVSSYRKLEPSNLIPTPQQRIEFLQQVYKRGIHTILTVRPLCPNSFIPITEPLEIIEKCHSFSTAILSSEIVVNDSILKRLGDFPAYRSKSTEPLMECLQNNLTIDHVDVTEELRLMESKCRTYGKKLFYGSCEAVEYIKSHESAIKSHTAQTLNKTKDAALHVTTHSFQ